MSDHDDMPESASADAESPLEPWLQLLADDYHRPPPAPRKAMWARTPTMPAADAPATPVAVAVVPRATTVDSGRVAASPAGDRFVASADDGRDDGLLGDQAGASAPYRLAAAQHLGQAEALLTVFRAESTLDAADPSLQRWARELLTTTRLLLDSPAARDQRLGALLDELEPVLVQIVQLPAARVADIARSLERSDLLTQLRSAVPAGPAGPQREELLLKSLRDDPDVEVRSQAVFWLAQTKSPRATEILEEVLRTSTDGRVRERAVFALSQRPADEAVPALLRVADTSPSPRLRKRAIFWLGQSKDARALAYFERVLVGKP